MAPSLFYILIHRDTCVCVNFSLEFSGGGLLRTHSSGFEIELFRGIRVLEEWTDAFRICFIFISAIWSCCYESVYALAWSNSGSRWSLSRHEHMETFYVCVVCLRRVVFVVVGDIVINMQTLVFRLLLVCYGSSSIISWISIVFLFLSIYMSLPLSLVYFFH